MKTAISVPDSTFHEVERRAHDLGMSRSEFFATAARFYLDALDTHSLTARVDEALEHIEADDSGAAAAARGRRTIAAGNDW